MDGELKQSKRRQLEDHLGSCRRCSDELERLREVREHVRLNLVASLPEEDSRRFWENVERRIDGVRPRRWWKLEKIQELFWFHPKLTWTSAAVLGTTVLLFAADVLFRPALPPPTPLGPTATAPKTVIESVEGGPNSSVILFSTPDQQLQIIWVLEQGRS
jgi:anti-sigma factor RsiW